METKANYVLIGAFTIVVTVFLLLFALWAAKYSSDRSWNQYDVVFAEPVTGLTEGSSVLYNGIAVGTVESLMLSPDDPRHVIARLKLKATTPVRTDTSARMSMTSLTGPPVIQLTGGSPEAPPLLPGPGGEVPVIRTAPSALQNISDTANRLVERLDRVLSEDNVARMTAALEHIEQITGAVASERADLAEMIASARRASAQLEQTLATTSNAMTSLDRELVQKLPAITARLESTLARLDSAAQNADAILGENRAAIHSFANDGLGQLGPTLAELRALVRDLRRISDRLDANPARYLLGRDTPREFEP